ncbi:nucleoside-diphosphate-sugar pyrophosphorylase [Alkalihalophilus pseudofirmus]|uniref:sugar phosphate nucleotidyltransferase n=1 Tax=Alkalihalophilus pseudofirmus TaxID=79885 RepID=UPI00095126C0|nr:nucleoside-diphosphate-sugar pyrophosphorylase [Alkalihalophilus pseudofirmus]
MKGVIMAGGKGTRLRPLTCQLPKPMVPLLQKPVMQYSIELLKQHGITDIAVTVHYLPDEIRDYFGDGQEFGVHLTYFEETEPLGTAGSVKQAEAFLDEPFVVVSGDALTDFDLEAGINFHKAKDALVSIFMKQVPCPLEFGVIMTNQQHEIIRFLEKPSVSEVFSDTVNTGIYVMDPSIFNYIESDKPVDFSKDVFPRILEDRAGIYGYAAEGYWSDIGNLEQYRQAHMDLLNRDVKAEISGIEVEPGIWMNEHVTIEEGVKLEAPVFVGAHSTVRSNAKLGAFSIVGKDSIVSEDATIKRSVLWDGVYVGQQAELRGVTICGGVQLGSKSTIYEQAVLGSNCQIEDDVCIQPGMKIWPHKRIQAGSVISQSVIWNDQDATVPVLKSHRASGIANVEMTPEHVSRLGAGFASAMPVGSTFLISGDDQSFTRLLKLSLAQGVQATGVNVTDLEEAAVPSFRKIISAHRFQGGAHLRVSEGNRIVIELFDQEGLPIATSVQKEIDKIVTFNSYRRVAFDRVGEYEVQSNLLQEYTDTLKDGIDSVLIESQGWRVSVHGTDQVTVQQFSRVLQSIGCVVETSIGNINMGDISVGMTLSDSEIGFVLGETGEFLTVLTREGHIVTDEEKLAMFVDMHLHCSKKGRVALPLYAGASLEEYIRSFQKEVIRTKASAREMMIAEENVQLYCFDAAYAAVHLIQTLSTRDEELQQYLSSLPVESMFKQEVPCQTDQKGMVMRALMEALKEEEVELIEGMKVRHPEGGWTYIVPDQNEPIFTIYAQADEPEVARVHANYYIEQIHELLARNTAVHTS